MNPDGRPLYAYRFPRAEFDRIGVILRRSGISALDDRHGAALIVAHIAEWFRRERSGGHWDWIRPLRAIGLDYGPSAQVRYRDVEALVSTGLRVWKRPEPKGNERLLAIVREAGFPVASVREDPRIASWLKNAVLTTERGFSVRDAVGEEAWRVSDRLAQALLEPASELCEKVVELRAFLPSGGDRDPVESLDQMRPGWRGELPFDIECADIRAMVEQIVRARDKGTSALSINRYLSLVGNEWQARASLNLSGQLDLRRLAPSVASALQDGRRARILPRPPLCYEPIPVAAVETVEGGEGGQHELRPLVARFDTPLALEEEAKLAVHIGNSAITEFIAPGGEALTGPIIALQVEQVDDNELPTSLRIIGSSSVKTNRSVLALAVSSAHLRQINFSSGYTDLGQCIGTDRRVISFFGTATLALDGTSWSWRTTVDCNAEARPILVGNLIHNAHESVFRGMPQFWIERDGLLTAPKRQTLYWRPRGRGAWRTVDNGKPWGVVDLAVIENGELQFSTAASIVPPSFNATFDRRKRELRVSGADAALLAAQGMSNLSIRFEGDVALVDLGPPSKAATVTVKLRWDAELALSFTDPSYELRLIDASDAAFPSSTTLAVDDLKGWRICATGKVPVYLELRAKDAPSLTISRIISGDTPLAAFTSTIRQLLGSSESLDARVELSALGRDRQIVDVRWYAQDLDPFDAPKRNAFSALETTHGLDLQGISLPYPAAGATSVTAPAEQAEIRNELSRSLPPGPWLLYGRRRNGAKIRPRIVGARAAKTSTDKTLLERAFAIDEPLARSNAFIEAYAHPEQLLPQDRRTLVDLLLISRREGLPLSSIEALKMLSRSPGIVPLLLAYCESLDERAALLDLQRDLPFLWCSTTIRDWLHAFSNRIEYARARASEFGIDSSVVHRREMAAISEIVGLRPELAGHAKAVFLKNVSIAIARDGGSVDGTSVHFLQINGSDGVRREIDRLIGRHDDLGPPPQGLLTSESKKAYQARWAPYDPSFADVISVPLAIADHASQLRKLTDIELRRCRDVWLYDSEYFEAIMPVCIDVMLRSAATTATTGKRRA